ncbi:MAG: hypothetical protein UY16_C0028G0001, partial [Candidatus Gottesmanbacteria bacterium GW2011_GWA2_47_9]
MSKELFVFDHDGTLTDPVATHDAYTDIFENQFARATGLPREVITKYIEPERKELRTSPEIYGWENDQGFIVTPATFDTYVLNRIAAKRAIVKMREALEPNIPDQNAVSQFLGDLHYASYPQLDPFYRPDAAYTMRELLPLGKLVIVSSSKPDHLLTKLQPFLRKNNIFDDNIEVRGNAQKHLISPNWERVPWSMKLPGLDTRDVLLRRENYGSIILSLGQRPYIIV